MLPLQILERAVKLAIANFGSAGKLVLQGC